MGKRRRISKRQLKHDKLLETAAKSTKFMEHHKNPVIVGTAVVLAAVLITMMVVRGQRSANLAANAALALGGESLDRGLYVRAEGQYQAVIDEFPGTDGAGAATCYMGTIAFRQGKYDQALEHFDAYLDKYSRPGPFQRIALEGRAAVLQQRRHFDSAASIYEDLAAQTADHPAIAARYLTSAATCYRALGDWSSLKRAAAAIVDRYPESPYALDARIALAEAEARILPG